MAAQTTRAIHADNMTGALKSVVRDTIANRFEQVFLQDMRPQIQMEALHNERRHGVMLQCRIKTQFSLDHMASIFIDNDAFDMMQREPDWMHYQAETMGRLVETGIFLAYINQHCTDQNRNVFDGLTDIIESVHFKPNRPYDNDKVNEEWLAVVTFKNSVHTYRKIIREITEDPNNFAAFLTLVKK